jgi:hypothetical protein
MRAKHIIGHFEGSNESSSSSFIIQQPDDQPEVLQQFNFFYKMTNKNIFKKRLQAYYLQVDCTMLAS